MRHFISIPLTDDLIHIRQAFNQNSFKLYVVGGAIRDALLGMIPKDYDLVTDALPDRIEELMKGIGLKTIPTGKAFGVINVFTEENEYEIATFRSDIGSGRRPERVEFSDIQTDANRRDLTINALYYDMETDEIIDLVGGMEDIKNNVIKTVGRAEQRFAEDRLRILRTLRFSSRLDSKLDDDITYSIKLDNSLTGISAERIRDEFIKGIKTAKNVRHFLRLIDSFDLFDRIFPNLIINGEYSGDHDHIVTIAILLQHNSIGHLGKQLNILKYTNDEVRTIEFLIELLPLDINNFVKLKRRHNRSIIKDNQCLSFGDHNLLHSSAINAFLNFELTVDGNELMKTKGLKPGKELGDLIEKLEKDKFQQIIFSITTDSLKDNP